MSTVGVLVLHLNEGIALEDGLILGRNEETFLLRLVGEVLFNDVGNELEILDGTSLGLLEVFTLGPFNGADDGDLEGVKESIGLGEPDGANDGISLSNAEGPASLARIAAPDPSDVGEHCSLVSGS